MDQFYASPLSLVHLLFFPSLPSALPSSTVLEPSSSSGMRVSLDQDFLYSHVHSCWLPQISLQAGLQPRLSPANLASWFQGA